MTGTFGGAARLELARDVGLDGREHQPHAVGGHLRRVLDDDAGVLGRERLAAEPLRRALVVLDRVRVLLARRAARRRQLADLEQRVTGQRREELLAGEAGGPNDGDGNA